jgi:hypothetical protein
VNLVTVRGCQTAVGPVRQCVITVRQADCSYRPPITGQSAPQAGARTAPDLIVHTSKEAFEGYDKAQVDR